MEKNHQMKSQIRKTLITAAFVCSLLAPTAHACTGIRLIAEDGTVVHARTMEFAIDIHRYSLRRDDDSARLRAIRNHARRTGRPQVEGEVRQRRSEWGGTTN